MKIIASLLLFLSFSFTGSEASAQASKTSKNPPYTMRDGVTRKGGKLVVIQNGKQKPLTSTFTAGNGTKVKPDGTIVFADGTSEKIKEGYAVNMQGEKVIFADDMIAPAEIRKHQKEVTGKDATNITVIEKTKVTINDSTGRKAVYDTTREEKTE